VSIENNASRYGAGFFANFDSTGSSVALDHVVVHDNVAGAAAGGLGASLGDNARFDLLHSQVYANTAYQGGGVYFQDTSITYGIDHAHIEDTEIRSNIASLSAGMESHSGDATHPVTLVRSHLHDNHASVYGGALGNYGSMTLTDSTVDANVADMKGGGIYDYEGGLINVVQSTLSGNSAQTGGAIFVELFIHSKAGVTLTNSTVSGNSAVVDGGGIYAQGGQVGLFNATIAENLVDKAFPDNGGTGGGVYAVSPALVAAQNTLIAYNRKASLAALGQEDDCNGPLTSGGFNLIELSDGCSISGTTAGNVTGQDPLLGPLRINGGLTQTRALLPGSPAIGAGQTPDCLDAASAVITTDQRGKPRPSGSCDIGAYQAPEPESSALTLAAIGALAALVATVREEPRHERPRRG
jgi:predicted outer membrane repeat protein